MILVYYAGGLFMKKIVWKNKSNNQLCLTIPSGSDIREGDVVEVEKTSIKRIAYSGVVGDLFHYGHLHSIQFAKSISDYNICGVFTDKAVEEYRSKPIANLKERKAIFSSLKCVDRVMVQDGMDPTGNLKKIHEEFPNAEIILVHGSDWKYVPGSEYIGEIGGSVVKHPYYSRLSNFKIINKIIENKGKFKDITEFTSMIGGKGSSNADYGNKVIVSTKADTLKTLKPLLKKSRIEKLFSFTVSDWKNNKNLVLGKIKEKFLSDRIVIRSSAVNEDRADKSMAGCFVSVLNVDPSNLDEVEKGIREVIDSYKKKVSESSFNQVIVQSQTKNISLSGVVFTRTLETNSPYYVINYDDSTGQTDTVTKGVENRTIKILRSVDIEKVPKNMRNILLSVKEIEDNIPGISLDIEFAVNQVGEVIIFQVRPLTTGIVGGIDDNMVMDQINILNDRFFDLSQKKDHLTGSRTIFADMPDWNPAEIIGDCPNHLDYSIYDYIITDSAWHEARTSQGYYNVNPAKLVVLFGNKPYIDVRNSFNSFVPASISKDLRGKLVNFYLDKLEKNPGLQDKVEFDIVYSCYDLCFDERSKELSELGFGKNEIGELKNALICLTNDLITNSKESIAEDLKSINSMESHRGEIRKNSKLNAANVNSILENSQSLFNDCREKGTVQFSRLARLAFIGKIILNSLVKKGIIDGQVYDNFMGSITTVAKDLHEDFKLIGSGKLNKDDFIKKYYHLRPGSYDITSSRYESNFNLIRTIDLESSDSSFEEFKLRKEQADEITKFLQKEGLKFDAQTLLDFTRKSIESREYAKFEFTKNLSDALELIALAGGEMGFTRQELAMLNINNIFMNQMKDRHEITNIWKGAIKSRTLERKINEKIVMPPILFSEKDLKILNYYTPRPNYITQKKIRAELVNLGKNSSVVFPEIDGKIVMIENGDPGYDWIFTRKPAGLITKYGGVASHMSIRCAEFGLPAAIGCGILFEQLLSTDWVILDCASKKIMMDGVI